MKILKKNNSGTLIIEAANFEDSRGSFMKAFDRSSDVFIHYEIQQVNYVKTRKPNTIRGLHCQIGEFAESKIFRVIAGRASIVCVDMRKGSDTFMKYELVPLDDDQISFFIPRGFATGYITHTPDTCVLYTTDNRYAPHYERGIRWNDPTINIPWNIEDPIISEKDNNWPTLDAKNAGTLFY